MRLHRSRAALAALVLVASLGIAGGARASGGCSAAVVPGGDWPSYGHDLANTRTQPDEHAIGASNVATLRMAWGAGLDAFGATGTINSTPAVANGCVYVGTDTGDIVALNADEGVLAWKKKVRGGVFSVAVSGGAVYALVNQLNQPYAIAFDAASGEKLWESASIGVYPGYRTNASAVVTGGLLFFGWSVPEGDANAHAGFAILDASTGEILRKTYVIPEQDWQYGYGGGGLWGTAVVDEANGYAYDGTSNPTSKKIEHRNTNAILKIDVNPARATFGQIVDVMKGTFDQYYPGTDRQEACRQTGDKVLYAGFSVTCAQFDLDFGASPNLFRNAEGHLVVGELQKSGVYHAAYADTMEQAWTQVVAPPCLQCNFASTATNGGSIFGIGTPPGHMMSFAKNDGAYEWVAPTGDGIHINPASVANGVVYTTDIAGTLWAFDETTGALLARRVTSADTATQNAAESSAGVSIARGKIYVPAGGALVAYTV
jgi:polyvinyl alcohol dehydrogenase (cytochrome)